MAHTVARNGPEVGVIRVNSPCPSTSLFSYRNPADVEQVRPDAINPCWRSDASRVSR